MSFSGKVVLILLSCSKYSLKMEPMEFSDRLIIRYERKRTIEDYIKICLRNWKNEVAIAYMEKTEGRTSLEMKRRNSVLNCCF